MRRHAVILLAERVLTLIKPPIVTANNDAHTLALLVQCLHYKSGGGGGGGGEKGGGGIL